MLVLSLLDGEPMHGYRCVQELQKRAKGLLQFREGTIYPLLYTLRDRGLVRVSEIDDGSSRMRKVYEITDAGKKELLRQRQSWADLVSATNIILDTQ